MRIFNRLVAVRTSLTAKVLAEFASSDGLLPWKDTFSVDQTSAGPLDVDWFVQSQSVDEALAGTMEFASSKRFLPHVLWLV